MVNEPSVFEPSKFYCTSSQVRRYRLSVCAAVHVQLDLEPSSTEAYLAVLICKAIQEG